MRHSSKIIHHLRFFAITFIWVLFPLFAQAQTHPRLFFGPADVAGLRAKATQEPWASILARAETAAATDSGANTWFYRPAYYAAIHAFKGDADSATKARDLTLEIISSTWWQSSGNALDRGTAGGQIAITYDLCYQTWAGQPVPATVVNPVSGKTVTVAAKFTGLSLNAAVSLALKENADNLIASGGSGWPGDNSTGNNWFAVRYGGAGLGYLSTDETVDAAKFATAVNKLTDHFKANLGAGADSRGWNAEGIGYLPFPGQTSMPFVLALIRNTNSALGSSFVNRDLRASVTGLGYTLQTPYPPGLAIARRHPFDNNFTGLGLRPEFNDDHPLLYGEGTGALAFALAPAEYQPGIKWMFRRLWGDLGDQTWDMASGQALWSLLYYPVTLAEQNPAAVWGLAWRDPSMGMFVLRNRYQDANDSLFQATANLRPANGGHNGPDSLTFRLWSLGNPWVVGAGRNYTATVSGASTLSPDDPADVTALLDPINNSVADTLLRSAGDGYLIFKSDQIETGVESVTRRYAVDYDSALSGAAVTVIISDDAPNAAWWRLNTPAFNTITTDDAARTFTFTSPDGKTMRGKVLWPATVAFRKNTAVFDRTHVRFPFKGINYVDSPASWLMNYTTGNNWVDFATPDGRAVVALTVVDAGLPHPAVTSTGTGNNQTVTVGSRVFTFAGDTIAATGWERPALAITSPAPGQNFNAGPAPVTLAGTTLSGGSAAVTRIEISLDDVVIGQTTPAINGAWSYTTPSPLSLGAHKLTARAIDAALNERTAEVNIRLNNSAPPVVALTWPGLATQLWDRQSLVLRGTAADPDGTLNRVELWADGVKLGNATLGTGPLAGTWTYAWTAAPTGTKRVTAIAYDNSADSASTPVHPLVFSRFFSNIPIYGDAARYSAPATDTGRWTTVEDGGDIRLRARYLSAYFTKDMANQLPAPSTKNWRLNFTARVDVPLTHVGAYFNVGLDDAAAWSLRFAPQATVKGPPWAPYAAGTRVWNSINGGLGYLGTYRWHPTNADGTANSRIVSGDLLDTTGAYAGVPDTGWHQIQVDKIGKTIRVRVDNNLILEDDAAQINLAGPPSLSIAKSDGTGGATEGQASFDNVAFLPLDDSGNPIADAPASLAWTSPADLAVFSPGQTATLSGTCADADGIAQMRIYSGFTLLGQSTVSGGTFSYSWTNLPLGTHSVSARLTDLAGNTTDLPARTLLVGTATGNSRPAVTIGQNPALLPPSFGLSGSITDSDGPVVLVQIYKDSALIGTATRTGSAWTYTVTGLPTGTYAFTARAFDDLGATTDATFNAIVDGNAPPSITDIPNASISLGDAPPSFSFTIADDTTPAANLVVTATSSNPALVPATGLTLGGTGSVRTIAITPAPGQSGSTTITVTVNDGAKSTSDLLVFTVTAPPVATTILITPADPSVAPGGTMQFSASVLDQYGAALSPQPASFAWSVSGGGTINASGLFTAGSLLGLHQVNATASGLSGSTNVGIAFATGPATLIDWQGDYVPSNQSFLKGNTNTAGNWDNDSLADDSRLFFPVNLSTPLIAPSATYTGIPIYGGYEVRAFDITTLSALLPFEYRITHLASPGDWFGFRIQETSTAVPSNISYAAAFLFQKADFAQGGATKAVTLDRTSRFTLSVGAGYWSPDSARWLVVQDGKYYLSLAPLPSGTGDKTLTFASDASDGSWAEISLADGLVKNFDALTYLDVNFTDITAFGVLVKRDTLADNTASRIGISRFKVEAALARDLPIATSLELSPSTAALAPSATHAFTATVLDQYGTALDPAPTVTWTVSGGGTINGSGTFTAASTPGGPWTVTAASSGFTATASVTIDAALTQTPPVVAYAGATGTDEFKDVFELSDGTLLIAGTSENLDWITAPQTLLPPLGIPNRATGRTAFLLRLSADLQTPLGVWHLPPGQALDIRWIKTTAKPGSPTGALYISGRCDATSGDYFIARLDQNFLSTPPTGFSWVKLAKSSAAYGDNLGLQTWDVGGDGRLAYLDETGGTVRVLFLDATGAPLKLNALRGSHWLPGATRDDANRQPGVGSDLPATTASGISFPADLRSWNDPERLALLPDGNGSIKRGTWPLDLFHPVQDLNGGTTGTIAYGYTGYKSVGKHRVAAIAFNRDTNAFAIGFNIQSKFWDAPVSIEQPDFEPAVIAYTADGALKWWSRLYAEVVDANTNGVIDSGETRISAPDQYVDGLALDYSTTPARLVVLARCHGSGTSNFWPAHQIAANPGGSGFQNQFTGTEGNIHIGWLGKFRETDGTLLRSSFLAGYFRNTALTQALYAEPIHDGWPSHNSGWNNLTTTRAETGSLRTDAAGRTYVVGVGPRMVTTANAFQKLPKITPTVNEGVSPWAAFARVFDADLRNLAYSTALTGAWTYPSAGANPEGADNTDLYGIYPTATGLFAVGRQRVAGNSVPLTRVPPWATNRRADVSALFAKLSFVPGPIITIPASPLSLAATAASSRRINLTWTAPVGAASYRIEAKTSPSGTWSTLATLETSATNYTADNLTPGTAYLFRVSALNSAGPSLPSAEAAATTLDPYASWFSQHFGSAPPSYTADPDADGLPNLLEYALNGTPTDATSAPLPTAALVPSTSTLTLTFFRARAAAELTYTVQSSSNLTTWTDLAINPGAVGQDVTVTDQPPSNSPRRYLRLKVTTP